MRRRPPWRRRWRLSTQIFVFQALLLIVTSLIGLALVVREVQGNLDHEAELRALAIAHSVAATPEIVAAIEHHNRDGVVQQRATAIDRATGSSFIVVTDDHGIRYSHPNPSLIGKRVSTSPEAALHGRTVLAVQTGTLGRSARAKIPLRAANHQIIGEVSVGLLVTKLHRRLMQLLPGLIGYWALLVGLGLLCTVLLSRRLKRQTLGLEPGTIADLFREREAVLKDIREGVLAVDEAGRLRVLNDEAQHLLDMTTAQIGCHLDELELPPELVSLFNDRSERSDVVLLHAQRLLVASCRPIRQEGRGLGAVVTLRDRTELERLSRELGGVRSVTETLRAQAHEFSNRLHVISGLLQLGKIDEAQDYVQEITRADDAFSESVGASVAPSLLRALLVAKVAVATERGVALSVDESSSVQTGLDDADTALSVLGNLVDNALDAAARDSNQQPWVDVRLRADEDVLHLRVSDSGPGVPNADRSSVFVLGHTTKPRGDGVEHGVGLALVAQMTYERGGTISVTDHPAGGAVFDVALPGVLAPPRSTASASDLLDTQL